MRIMMKIMVIVLVCATALAAAGCGTTDHQAGFLEGYRPTVGTRIEVGPVGNETGQSLGENVEKELACALKDELSKENLLYTGGDAKRFVLITHIVEFKKGSTWRRWMWPGWGAAVLAIRCDLKDGERVVGCVEARRSFKYANPGAVIWRSVFDVLAADVAKDLREQIPQVEK